MIETSWRDVRYALRSLRRTPGFTLAAVVTLALGVGANTGIFSLVNAVLLRPLPVEQPDELVSVFTSDFSGPIYGASSFADYQDFRNRTDVFTGLVAYTGERPFTLRDDTQAERLLGSIVTGNYFDVLGLNPAAGRFLRPNDDRDGVTPVAVIGYGLWQRRFGGSPAVIGQTLTLNSFPFTVAGVAPQGFTGVFAGQTPELWIPMSAARAASVLNEAFLTSRSSRGLMVTGRLRPGVTPQHAQVALDVLAAQLHAAYPAQWSDVTNSRRRVTVAPERESRFGRIRPTLVNVATLLMTVVGFVLLLACANVANLLLARASDRRREIGTRLALGADRTCVIRHVLAESLVLAAGGAIGGVVIAWWTVRAFGQAATALPLMPEVDLGMDLRVLGFTAAIALAAALLFGLVPALKASRVDLVNTLRDGDTVARARRFGFRNVLVTFQMAISLVLLVVGALFFRSLLNAQQIDPGFTARNVALLTIETPREYAPAAGLALYARILERISALPGVQSASFSAFPPVAGLSTGRAGVAIEGYTPKPGEDMELYFNPVSARYLETLGVPLARGRSFTEADIRAGRNLVVVNETLAERFWLGQDSIGRRLRVGNASDSLFEVIGVARDSKYRTLGEDRAPYFYVPLAGSLYRPRVTLHVRTSGDPTRLLPLLRAEIGSIDPAVPVFDVRTLDDQLASTLAPARLGSAVLGAFAMLGLVLAAVGLYGVMAYAIARRTREIGIRIALGATRGAVLRLVVGDGLRVVGSGMVVGLAVAMLAARPLQALLYGISGPERGAVIVSIAVLLTAATAASYLPARQATTVNPVEALRVE